MKQIYTNLMVGLLTVGMPLMGSTQNEMEKIDTRTIKAKWFDIPYAEPSSAQKLNIYLPNTGEEPYPVIMAIHGGAYKFGDKADGQLLPMLEGLQRGYAVVSINYRLSGEAIWPAAIYDVKAAIRWVKANASQYRLDSGKIALWGGSAGGHLSALAGTSAGIAELEDTGMGNADQTTTVQAVVDWFGPTDFLKMDEQFQESGIEGQKHSTADSFESQWFGKPIMDAPELVNAANPETYITPDDPPFLIQHGTDDPIIPVRQSQILAEKLSKILGPENVIFEPLQGAGHGGYQFSEPANVTKILDFLDRYLK